MKQVILHIGMHKTGSTSIQSSLKGYLDDRVKYASFKEENHSIPLYTIFSEDRYDYHVWKTKGLDKQQIETKRQEYLEIFESDLNDSNYDKLIISGEDIAVLDEAGKEALVHMISKNNIEIKVVMFVREPLGLAISDIQQWVRLRRDNVVSEYRVGYKIRIKKFCELIPKENIFVEDLHQAIAKSGCIVKRFAEIAGLTLKSGARLNESMSLQAFALIYRLNKLPLKILGNKAREVLRAEVVNSITSHFSCDAGFQKADKKMAGFLLNDAAVEECTFLREEFGIDYGDISVEKNLDKFVDYLNNSLNDMDEEIQKLFAKLNVSYSSDISLEQNLLELFVTMLTTTSDYSDFNAAEYLKHNRDIEQAGVDPYRHFIKYGMQEGRQYK